MQCVEVFVFGIDPVAGKAAAQSVGAVVHRFHGFGDHFAGHFVSLFGNDGGDRASGRNSHLAFNFHGADTILSADKPDNEGTLSGNAS